MKKSFSTPYATSIKWALCVFYLIAVDASGGPLKLTIEEYANNPYGNVIFLRHAYAPGMDANGQPAKFKIDDCSTQRNLDSRGIEQAVTIGEKFGANAIRFGIIYSSQWCRCLQTGQLLKLGKVVTEASLNSGFRGLFKKEETLSKLRENLQLLKDSNKRILMITHSGVISAITGLDIPSGGAVAYNIINQTSKVISME